MVKNELLFYFMDKDEVIFFELFRFVGIGELKLEILLIDFIDE